MQKRVFDGDQGLAAARFRDIKGIGADSVAGAVPGSTVHIGPEHVKDVVQQSSEKSG